MDRRAPWTVQVEFPAHICEWEREHLLEELRLHYGAEVPEGASQNTVVTCRISAKRVEGAKAFLLYKERDGSLRYCDASE